MLLTEKKKRLPYNVTISRKEATVTDVWGCLVFFRSRIASFQLVNILEAVKT